MKAMIAIALVLAATPALAADPPMPSYPGVPADLAKAAIPFDRAQVKADRAALEQLLADDYLLINSQDQRESKAQFIADYTTPGFTMAPFTIDDQVVKVWADGAILGGAVTATGMSYGKPYSVRLRFTDVWAKRAGKWRVIFTHVNHVAAKS
ncbi:MAG: nuclear transport factor 2 family protein [Sphingomonas sp.]